MTKNDETEQRLRPKNLKAIELLVSGDSITKISKKLKISRTTIYSWLGDPHFKAELTRLQRNIQKEVEATLLSLAPKAIELISACLQQTKNLAVRLKASEIILKGIGLLDAEKWSQKWPFYFSDAPEFMMDFGLEDQIREHGSEEQAEEEI